MWFSVFDERNDLICYDSYVGLESVQVYFRKFVHLNQLSSDMEKSPTP